MRLSYVALASIGLFCTLHLVAASSRSGASYHVERVAHGIDLSLALPRRAYAWNALVSGKVTVRNVSRHTVRVTTFIPFNGSGSPEIDVMTRDRNVVYPPALPKVFTIPEQYPGQVRLEPGQTVDLSEYLILRAAHLVATTIVKTGSSTATVKTPPLTVHLFSQRPPRTALYVSRGNVFADVRSPWPVHGRLLFMSAAECAYPKIQDLQQLTWALTSHRLRPEVSGFGRCPHLIEWHAVAGWLNRPVATITYAGG